MFSELDGRVLSVNVAKPFLEQKKEDIESMNLLEEIMAE
jgi:hypothetical protein